MQTPLLERTNQGACGQQYVQMQLHHEQNLCNHANSQQYEDWRGHFQPYKVIFINNEISHKVKDSLVNSGHN